MEITIQVAPEVAEALRTREPDAAPTDVLAVAQALGVPLRPLHPDATDQEGASYFVGEVANAGIAESIRARLSTCPGVIAAYIKPADEPP
jgi:hypothetical protein